MIMINEMKLALACNVSIDMRSATFLISKNGAGAFPTRQKTSNEYEYD